MMANRVHEHLNNNDLFEEFQSGFKAHDSSETALLKLAYDIFLALNNGLESVLVLLDLSAAFHTVEPQYSLRTT